ncbi:PAC2 family protein [Bifidobacterium saguinibicoloris]|uniref:PAC2 family protein n=1 Tax=Bifidobacterium saguinibicoloris TaxID=2834433 RepID=UPI001C573721|nr:PAC2 family protein [Bifidobacterium saguinibicoloris]MBW3080798.1 PAC2 family protein [Bifidobacterium saguinibicoloris]
MSEERVEGRRVLIAAFDGWNDACQSATNVIRHLVDRYDAREIRHISCDGYYDYQVSRPMLCRVTGRPRIIWPQTTFYEIELSPDRVVYAQIAPEPNYRWREYCRQSLRIADELDVDRIITLGSMYADCPHTRPLPVDVTHGGYAADRPDGSCACGESDTEGYTGPVGIPTVLDDMAREQSFDTASIWVSIPQYAGSDDCPQATLSLLHALEREMGTSLDAGSLNERADAWRAKVTMLTRCSDQLAEYVRHLERDRDAADRARHDVGDATGRAEQLVRETEDFLKNL